MVKDHVRGFWEVHPCGAGESRFPEGGRAFFGEVEQIRFSGDEFMSDVIGFDRWSGRAVLEVGCGLGTDFVRFLRTGARGVAIDLTERAIQLTRRRLDLEGLRGAVLIADAEVLPFQSDTFDLVYAWGVFHHTPNPEAAVREALRVCRPGGTVLAMVYHRHSLFALQVWLRYALARGRPWQSLEQVIADYVESPSTRAYRLPEVRRMFSGLENLSVVPVVTRYDARIARRIFLPIWVRRLVPRRFGWFLVIRGTKPALSPAEASLIARSG